MPWEREDKGGKAFKYQYHPHGDKNQPLREAPSALNTVIVPNVTLPKVISSPFVSIGPRRSANKDEVINIARFLLGRISMIALTSTARRSGTSEL